MFDGIAMKLFGKLVGPYTEYFEGLKYNIRRARIDVTIQQYLCNSAFFSLLAFMFAMVATSVFFSMLVQELAYAYTLAIIVSLLAAAGMFFFWYYYPSMLTKAISSKMERSLPFAVSYMATSASSGMNPANLFKMLSLRGGEVGKEAGRIYTNVSSMGMSLTSALQRAAMRSPSPTFADLLWGMISIITTGGNMEGYLRNKSRAYMSQYRRILNDYAKQITLYTEVYITLIIVGSLFFIVLISIISPLSGTNVLFTQTVIVFFVTPVVSMIFMALLKMISPTE